MHAPNKNLLDINWLKDQYEVRQKSMHTIASELNVAVATVSKYIRRYGFTIRPGGQSKSLTAKANFKNKYSKPSLIRDFEITKESLDAI